MTYYNISLYTDTSSYSASVAVRQRKICVFLYTISWYWPLRVNDFFNFYIYKKKSSGCHVTCSSIMATRGSDSDISTNCCEGKEFFRHPSQLFFCISSRRLNYFNVYFLTLIFIYISYLHTCLSLFLWKKLGWRWLALSPHS